MSTHKDLIEEVVEELEPLLKWPSNTEGNEAVRKLHQTLTTLVSKVEEEQSKLFNLAETKKDWQDHFYESAWESDTLTKTPLEMEIEEELSTFLPRHMEVYDWNLPYIDFITLVVRKHIVKALQPEVTNKKI